MGINWSLNVHEHNMDNLQISSHGC